MTSSLDDVKMWSRGLMDATSLAGDAFMMSQDERWTSAKSQQVTLTLVLSYLLAIWQIHSGHFAPNFIAIGLVLYKIWQKHFGAFAMNDSGVKILP